MPNVNSGSIAVDIFNGISPMPTNVSGILINIVDRNRYRIEQWTGATIGNVIAEQYQASLFDLSFADVLRMMAVQDMGAQDISLGDLNVSNANLRDIADQHESRAIMFIKSLSKSAKSFKARG